MAGSARRSRGVAPALALAALLQATPAPALAVNETGRFEVEGPAGSPRVTVEFQEPPRVRELETGDPRRFLLAFPGTIHRPTRTRLSVPGPLAKTAVLSQHDRSEVWLVVERDPSSRISHRLEGRRLVVEVLPPATGMPPGLATVPASPGTKPGGAPPGLPTKLVAGKPRIVIDPGHGGRDPGAIGRNTTDKAVALAVARAIQEAMRGDERLEVHFTRLEDRFVKLDDRAALARRVGADLFVSLHANSGHPSARGYEVYYLSPKGSRTVADRLVAERENGYEDAADDPSRAVQSVIDRIQLDMRRETNLNQASLLAGYMNKALEKTGQASRGVNHADFAVLRSVDVPSVLIELGFLSNAREEIQLMDKAFQAKQARAICEGILDYLKSQGRLEGGGPAKPLYYAVRPGDTPGVVSQRFGIDLVDLLTANGLESGASLYVNQVLTIPRDPIAALIGDHIE